MLSDADIDDIRARNPIEKIAANADLRAVLRKTGRGWIGSCPMCGGGPRAARFEIKGSGWVCAVCPAGGDVIKLVQLATGRTFLEAVEYLGGTRPLSADEKARLDRDRLARDLRQAREQNEYRDRARRAAYDIWEGHSARMVEHPVGRDYLAARGILTVAPISLRYAPDLAYFDGEEPNPERPAATRPRVIHRGPAMLAAIQGPDGRFGAVHQTWIDPKNPGEKARIFDPATGERMDAKKSRGSKAGGVIKLTGAKTPSRLYGGEGIETVLSAMAIMADQKRLRPGDAFWSMVDLGNLGGPANANVPHPSEKTPKGRAKNVPGPVPDFDKPSWIAPATVADLCLIGDGDSDDFLTRTALERGLARQRRAGLRSWPYFAERGEDFNDTWRGILASRGAIR
jgi:hypothetical protein